jgi:hypothetical protein
MNYFAFLTLCQGGVSMRERDSQKVSRCSGVSSGEELPGPDRGVPQKSGSQPVTCAGPAVASERLRPCPNAASFITERRPKAAAPNGEVPPAHIERHTAPEREITPSRRTYSPRRETRPEPERRSIARPPSPPRGAPKLQEKPQPNEGNKREEARPR